MNNRKAFAITMGKGFQLVFANGFTVSVQWGSGNYCENYGKAFGTAMKVRCQGEEITTFLSKPSDLLLYQSQDAEVAVIAPNGDFLHLTEYDDVKGRVSADEVADLIARVAALPADYNGKTLDELSPSEEAAAFGP